MLHHWLARVASLQREEGQDLAEYALLIALIAIVVIGAVGLLGGQLDRMFNDFTQRFAALL